MLALHVAVMTCFNLYQAFDFCLPDRRCGLKIAGERASSFTAGETANSDSMKSALSAGLAAARFLPLPRPPPVVFRPLVGRAVSKRAGGAGGWSPKPWADNDVRGCSVAVFENGSPYASSVIEGADAVGTGT